MLPDNTDMAKRAPKFLGSETLKFEEVNTLWKKWKDLDDQSFARRALGEAYGTFA